MLFVYNLHQFSLISLRPVRLATANCRFVPAPPGRPCGACSCSSSSAAPSTTSAMSSIGRSSTVFAALTWILRISSISTNRGAGVCPTLGSATTYCPRPFSAARINLMYAVSDHEGFNLRRDVYMRLAVFASRQQRFRRGWSGVRIILPPFRGLRHWSGADERPHSWAEYFDVEALQEYAPVLEAWEYQEEARRRPPAVHYVQLSHYDWKPGERFADRYQLQDHPVYAKFALQAPKVGERLPEVYGASNYSAASFHAARFQGSVQGLAALIREVWRENRGVPGEDFTVYLRNAEVVLHDRFGDAEYWRARRSMRFAGELVARAERFGAEQMRMAVGEGEVRRPQRWQDEKPSRSARGAPYICAHLRRRDFLQSGRIQLLPTIRQAAEQLRFALDLLRLRDIFLASDCTGTEFADLKRLLPRVRLHRYRPTPQADGSGDGAAAVVDQIVCAQARHFIGTYESTFSFRIQEEREIAGFAAESTFNTFCGREAHLAGGGEHCRRNSRWLIDWGEVDGDGN